MSQTPPTSSAASADAVRRLLDAVRIAAQKAAVFGDVRIDQPKSAAHGRLVCVAPRSAAPAEYRLDVQDGKLWVSVVTADRWLSESIETDLLHTGDKLEDLLEEELAELDYAGPTLGYQHFRSPSPEKLFTFKTELPFALVQSADAASIDLATKVLLAYEACFRRLGDMDAPADED